jgi:arabinan endo-1,5-alpha-L-arabinosidase
MSYHFSPNHSGADTTVGNHFLRLGTRIAAIFLLLSAMAAPSRLHAFPLAGTYNNRPVKNAADPSIASLTVGGVTHYYMYATSDPINEEDRTSGSYNYHLLPIYHSTDMVNWTYHSDAFTKRPKWVGNAGLWAPDIQYFNGKWYLYYSVAPGGGGKRTGGGSAIGVATSSHPAGPWIDSGGPVVEAQTGKAVIDSAVVVDDLGAGATGQRYLFYGSFAGGIFARKLSADGLRTAKSSEKRITAADRYEAAFIRKRNGYYYLFVSASACCDGELSGYSVFVGRSTNVLGPYVDKHGVSLLDSRVGGTPVLAMNGNKWIGPGHNAVITDFQNQDWFLYHAIDIEDPYFVAQPGFTKRPPMLDPLGGDRRLWRRQ